MSKTFFNMLTFICHLLSQCIQHFYSKKTFTLFFEKKNLLKTIAVFEQTPECIRGFKLSYVFVI